MKVLLSGVAQASHLSGVTRHAANVAQCLLTQPEVSEIVMVVASWQEESMRAVVHDLDPRLRIHTVSFNNTLAGRMLWHWRALPALAAELKADVVHLALPVAVKRSGWQCPKVVTLHDLYQFDIPENFGSPLKIKFNQFMLRQCLGAVDAIACVSESTARRLGSFFSKKIQDKAVTVYNSVERGPAMAAKGPFPDWDGGPFLFCVAQHRRNKNVVFAMRVFQRLLQQGIISPDTKFVDVGINGPETPLIHQFIAESGLADKIVLLRGISDAELQWCYSHCQLLLAPSSIEGFGLPIVEAMLNGCKVVASDIPVFREVGGDYCQYASLEQPGAEEAFVKAAQTAINNPLPSSGGTERFSGRQVGKAYVKLYTNLREGRPVSAPGPLAESHATTAERV